MKKILAIFLILFCVLASGAFATQKHSSGLIAASNAYTDPIYVTGVSNLSISGTWAGTVTLQRSFDNGANWMDVTSFTADVESNSEFESESGVCYRAGFKPGNYNSGTANIRISQ
jgi:hypothetical protein